MAYAIYNPATSYIPNDIVDYQGQLYVATGLQPNVGNTPDPAGTTYWGVVGGTSPGVPSGVQSVSGNGPGAGIITGGSPADVTVAVYQWPQLQTAVIRNSVTLPTGILTAGQTGTVSSVTDSSAPVLLFTSTFPPSLDSSTAYSHALFTVTFTGVNLRASTAAQQFFNVQIFPWIGSTPPPAGTTNVYSQCSSPINCWEVTTDAINIPVAFPQTQPFTVLLTPNGTLFRTVQWYAVNLQPGMNPGYLTAPSGPSIYWSGYAWNAANTTLG